jgi:hypothetical protein
LIITDGEASDADEFQQLLMRTPNVRVLVAIVGHSDEHDTALASFKRIALVSKRMAVCSFHGTTDAAAMADSLWQRLSQVM